MNSYLYDIGEMPRAASRFIAHVRREVQAAFAAEKDSNKLSQQELARRIGVHRSVINRQLMGVENMTLRSVAEMLWAMGWEPQFSARKPEADAGSNEAELASKANKPIVKAQPPTSSDGDVEFGNSERAPAIEVVE